MNLDPALSRTDRIGSAVMGAVLVAIAIVGNFDKPVVRGGIVLLGLAYVISGSVPAGTSLRARLRPPADAILERYASGSLPEPAQATHGGERVRRER